LTWINVAARTPEASFNERNLPPRGNSHDRHSRLPLAIFAIVLAAQWLAAYLGDFLRTKGKAPAGAERRDYGTILPAILTLLALLIGFSFSMAVSRYDQRKNYEETEANAIGTEYARADLLPTASAVRVRELLARYVEQRILFYRVRDPGQLKQIDAETTRLQRELWSAVAAPATAQPTPVAALAVSGMNDVLNSQGYTRAAWWNRIPVEAWTLMGLVAVACNLLLGFGERRDTHATLLVLPLIVAVPLFLIAEIDSPRGGIIRVAPQNLIALSQGFGGR
jgi:hypothetical protein